MPTAPVALTCGDPAGIGPEIIAAWLAAHPAEAAGVAVLGPDAAQGVDAVARPVSTQFAQIHLQPGFTVDRQRLARDRAR